MEQPLPSLVGSTNCVQRQYIRWRRMELTNYSPGANYIVVECQCKSSINRIEIVGFIRTLEWRWSPDGRTSMSDDKDGSRWNLATHGQSLSRQVQHGNLNLGLGSVSLPLRIAQGFHSFIYLSQQSPPKTLIIGRPTIVYDMHLPMQGTTLAATLKKVTWQRSDL